MSLNILYIAHEMALGGATRSLIALTDEMLKRGHRVFVLVPKKKGDLVYVLKKKDVIIIYSRYFWWMSGSKTFSARVKRFIKKLLNYISVFHVANLLKSHKIDVIHTNSSVVNIGGYLKKITKIPHVWHIREFGEEDHGITFNCSQVKAHDFIKNNSDKIVVISKALKRKYDTFIGEDKLITIYNGISSDYLTKKNHTKNSTINLLISGSLHEGKGQMEAIYAVKHLVINGLEQVHLNIAGTGSKDYAEKLYKYVAKNSLEDYVSFLGYTKDMKNLRKSMDIELVCSKSEAFGRVTIEAMMSMNPVIASDTGANPELIKSNFNGFLYQQGNYKDLAGKIEYFLKIPKEIREMGSRGYEYSKKYFTAEGNADNIETVYLEVINSVKI